MEVFGVHQRGTTGQREEEEAEEQQATLQQDSTSFLPVYGLLSRTLVHSPVVKKILPARIRRPDLNDVVFIGETFIELHILTEAGKLQKVGCKTDIRAEIRDARSFGSQRESTLSAASHNGTSNGSHHEDLPADILVMTTDSGQLQFVYARDCLEQGQVDFIISKKQIDLKGVHPNHLGRSIAVDPK
ncbi:hypothetical protein FN846DRAFT_775050 [Sphaerosporella brunnea]|uniref:RSE1/DDB1/CPSF1 first beta-propeller domain-containing protein n=1 Tax=Sphaerosporella brunnea TaxID=1250544 RepID=A0A5J5F2U2_9PEZI|nr:hypothetical protein FN846DRAFT_775050 [Sphaerosporella brunnea]